MHTISLSCCIPLEINLSIFCLIIKRSVLAADIMSIITKDIYLCTWQTAQDEDKIDMLVQTFACLLDHPYNCFIDLSWESRHNVPWGLWTRRCSSRPTRPCVVGFAFQSAEYWPQRGPHWYESIFQEPPSRTNTSWHWMGVWPGFARSNRAISYCQLFKAGQT